MRGKDEFNVYSTEEIGIIPAYAGKRHDREADAALQ